MVIGLVSMAVVKKIDPSRFGLTASLYETGEDGNDAYDPYLWRSIVPLELVTFGVNLWLAWKVFRGPGGSKQHLSGLMKTILRDNNLYLFAYANAFTPELFHLV